tara:strand:+ start:989 stop:1366 length:378 start_codon:yes stop_codon:yes gene_type:complete
MWQYLWYRVLKKKSKRTSKTIKKAVIKAEEMLFKKCYKRAIKDVEVPGKMNCLVRDLVGDGDALGLKVYWRNADWGYTKQEVLDKLRLLWNKKRIEALQRQNEELAKVVEQNARVMSKVNYYRSV